MSILAYSSNNKAASKWGFSDDVLPDAGVFDLSVKMGGEVVSSPIEEGSFTTYNKTVEPTEIGATLAFSGTDTFLQSVLDSLKTLHESVTVFSIKTPVYEFRNMTLQNYDYTMRREDGSGVLYVSASFVEIREVTQAYVTGSPITQEKTGDASAVSCTDNGIVQTEEISDADGNPASGSMASSAEYTVGEEKKKSFLKEWL